MFYPNFPNFIFQKFMGNSTDLKKKKKIDICIQSNLDISEMDQHWYLNFSNELTLNSGFIFLSKY